ncbi:quinone oxidoreductase-like protein 2 isoform X1 [Polistes fuscatus]|uniref:quinone oxidoreductase-like protein 2 isoform X1 n=1 Tax=Polistes fuscatus TaxID=30207 RepID=UPI001CA9416E|nr:quinone oxidoreductase-like protein 2 isoform X1 [Polistes fuscatus]XP_043493338.1 quinone oxidoreductase-like protein 2 isoform X1 [Polistes fuscatus]
MSVTIRRMFITHVSGIYWKNLRKQSIRLISNETPTKERSPNDSLKTNIPASEPGKFQVASLNKFDNSLVIQNVEAFKAAQPNEVVIDVHYCTINPSDVLLSKNLYTYEPKLPITLGYELVGELVHVGKNAQDKGYKTGDKVIALNKERYGGFAEQCIAEVGDIWKVPSNLRSVDAVCLLNDYMSALIALERVVTIDENDVILVNVGLSGIGLAAADLATNVFRSQVIGICINNDDATLIRNRGVFASLEYNDKKLLKHIKNIAGDKGIKSFLDGDGGEYFKKILKCYTDIYKSGTSLKNILRDDNFTVVIHHLSREGRVVIAGAAATKMDTQTGIEDGSFTITGFSLDEYRRKEPESYRQAGEDVLEFFEEGLIIPIHSMIFGLHKINDALRFSSERKTSAKVIIDIKDKERVDVVKNLE